MYDILAMILMAVLGGGGLYLVGRRGGKLSERENQERERSNDHINRMDAGRDAVRDGRSKPRDQRLRNNDGAW